VDAFEYTPEIGLFDLVGVSLYHGWVADPQEREMYQIVGKTSYNQLVSTAIGSNESSQEDDPTNQTRALLAREYLESTASQLTFHGLSELNHILTEGEFAVLFRNNHFTTIHKHKGVLYELITDLGYLNEYGHVWQSLVDITGDGEYYDSQFKSGTVQTEFGVETGQTDLDHEIALGLQHEVEHTPPTTLLPPSAPLPLVEPLPLIEPLPLVEPLPLIEPLPLVEPLPNPGMQVKEEEAVCHDDERWRQEQEDKE
jgi:hypothetical protein